MSNDVSEWDATSVVVALIVFGLPLTLLIPDFSVWNVLPKIRITRFHIASQVLTWPQINATIITLLSLMFCLFLEVRKRKLDDMVENVLKVSEATDTAMAVERERQAAAVKVCMELLDASTDHYEHLVMLRDDIRQKYKGVKQRPPTIEPSCSS